MPESDTGIFDKRSDRTMRISAASGDGIKSFLVEMSDVVREGRTYIDTIIPYEDASKVAQIRNMGQLIEEEYLPAGIHVCAYVPWVPDID